MSENSDNSGMNIFYVLGITFVVLKLCNIIDWSWWLVTLPFWGGLALLLFTLLAGLLISLIMDLINYIKRK